MNILSSAFRLSVYCLVIILLGSSLLQAQDQSIFWQLKAAENPNKKQKRLYNGLTASGYQLDQQALEKGELVLLFDNLAAVGKTLRRKKDKIVLNSDSTILVSLSKNEVKAQLYPQYKEKKKGKADIKAFTKAFKGKKNSPRAKDKPYQLNFGKVNAGYQPYVVSFYNKKSLHTQLLFANGPAQQISEFPSLAFSNCSPFNRYSYFIENSLRRYKDIVPIPYNPLDEITKTESFNLYFEKNKADYSQEDLTAILKFLKDNQYAIYKAEINAWASVEGSLENNSKLQEKRAEILIRALERYNNSDIEYTVHTEENWALFFQQLVNNGTDTLSRSKESWKELFTDKKEIEQWEPALSEQRKATLKLYVTEKLSAQQKHQLALKRFKALSFLYQNAPSHQSVYYLRSMLGIRDYLAKEEEKKASGKKHSCDLPENAPFEYTMANFYDQALRFEKGEPLSCSFEDLALSTFNTLLRLYVFQQSNRAIQPNPLLYSDLVSVQSYLYRKITEKKLPANLACELYVPDEPQFLHLYLNYLNFTNALKNDPTLVIKCNSSENEQNNHTFDWAAIKADSRYYYLLKKRILEEKKLEIAVRTDWIYEFDLYEFLYFNIYNWAPHQDHLFDPEVDVTKMAAYTKKLLTSMNRLCPHQAYALASLFHSKVVQETYLQQQRTPQAEESLQFLEGFFLKHAALLTADQAEHIVRQLLLANNISLRNERGVFALSLLERVDRRAGLNNNQKSLYFELADKMGIQPKITP